MALEMSASTRRNILIAGGWAALGAGLVLSGRLLGTALGRPVRATARLLHVGPPELIREGGKLSLQGIIVLHDERGFAAVSSRCTHLGCTITANARGFECSCHGSAFARDGRVTRGPANRPLPWYRVVLGDDGELRVDLETLVDAQARLRLGEA